MEENMKAKNILINARVNLPEYMIIKRKMQLLNITKISDYIRQATIFGTLFRFQDFYDMANEWIKYNAQINKIGTNINQIAHRVNSNPEKLELYSEDIEYLKLKIQEIQNTHNEMVKRVFEDFHIHIN